MNSPANKVRFRKSTRARLAQGCVSRVLRFFSPRPPGTPSLPGTDSGTASFRFGACETKFLAVALVALVSITMPAAVAAPLSGARITHIVNDVKTVDAGQAPRQSALNELVEGGKAVRTGVNSRTELLFNDLTITRLGANSHFSFSESTRELSISRGTILLQVPKGAGGARIQTAAVTAAITGTTILFEAGPKFITLTFVEGKGFLIANRDPLHRKVPITAGQQMKMANDATKIPPLISVSLSDLVKNSDMFNGTWGAQLEQKEIAAAIAAQLGRPSGEIGTLRLKGTALINKKPAKDGDIIHAGDVIETADDTATIALAGGGTISVEKSTRVRLGGGGKGVVITYVIFGHIDTEGLNNNEGDGATGAEPLPYIPVLGFGNFYSGGSASQLSANGSVLSAVLPGGLIGLFDSLGNFIRLR